VDSFAGGADDIGQRRSDRLAAAGEKFLKDSRVIELFLQYCVRFLTADAELILILQEDGFDLSDNGWNFTLPHLHSFLAEQSGMSEAPDYKSFRQQLFNSPINSRLAEKNGVIVVAENRSKVDLSTYRLQRC